MRLLVMQLLWWCGVAMKFVFWAVPDNSESLALFSKSLASINAK